jgi:hypothetical protein
MSIGSMDMCNADCKGLRIRAICEIELYDSKIFLLQKFLFILCEFLPNLPRKSFLLYCTTEPGLEL